MELVLWLIAVALVIWGIVNIVRGAVLLGIVLIIVGLLVGPGGVSIFDDDDDDDLDTPLPGGNPMSILLAVDDGLTNANYDMSDVFMLIATALAVLAGLAYATGNVGTVTTDNDPAPRVRPYGRFHAWAAALLAFAVAAFAFGFFLL